MTHVIAAIRLLDLSDVQIPAAVVIVSQDDARVLRDDVVMNAEDGLRVDPHPRDLRSMDEANRQWKRWK